MKKLFLLLIPAIAISLLGTLYLIFEVRILEILSPDTKEITRQNILRVLIGIPSLLALALSYWIILLKEKGSAIQSKKDISNINEPPHWKFHEKKTLSVGSCYDVKTKNDEKFFRITLKDISRKNMLPQYETPDSIPEEINTLVATLSISDHFMYHGFRVKKIYDSHFASEETFDLPQHDYQEESDSVFFFKTEHVTNGSYFFRCFVDHINPEKKEVDLDIYFIWENPAQQ